MGAENSQLKGLEIDKKAIEVSDHWSIFSAELPSDNGGNKMTIFQGETTIDTHLWGNFGPLEKATKNLMVYRHPSILKYVASWNRGSMKMLATENCRPLSLVIGTQSDIEICLGLKNILSSLIFLVEQASVRHLNVCTSSIYVTDDGTWKLAGFEFLWKHKEITSIILEKSKQCRYVKAVDANEVKHSGVSLEQYSFGVLCEETLRQINDDTMMPSLKDFKTYCGTHLKHLTPSMRPKLSAVMLHSYFNHEFISIHSFLNELPLKNQQEKQKFFNGIIDRLRNFDEQIVAVQLGTVLLSRIVLLDSVAQNCVLPILLKPKTDVSDSGLFSVDVFEKFIIPKLMQVFCVRDTQIRLILLDYFTFYMNLFTKEDLKEIILPQLLLGIKDTNDILVATTLRCLAELVEILGSAVVIGGNRLRIFADGRPQGPQDLPNHWTQARSITPVLSSVEFTSNSPVPDNVCDISESYASVENGLLMPERLSPDGGEDFKASEIDDEIWTDWEDELEETAILSEDANVSTPVIMENESEAAKPKLVNMQSYRKKSITEIEELDIKNQKVAKKDGDDLDFFKDMVPVIQKSNILSLDVDTAGNNEINSSTDKNVTVNNTSELTLVPSTRFDIKTLNDNEDGWGEEDSNVWDN